MFPFKLVVKHSTKEKHCMACIIHPIQHDGHDICMFPAWGPFTFQSWYLLRALAGVVPKMVKICCAPRIGCVKLLSMVVVS